MQRTSMRDLCQLYNLTPRAIRFYEEKGLITAYRDRGNFRVFPIEARDRLRWITLLRAAGVPLGQIADILDEEDSPGRRAERALKAVRAQLERQRQELARTEQVERSLSSSADPAPRVRRLGSALTPIQRNRAAAG